MKIDQRRIQATLDELPSLHELFGEVIHVRSSAPTPDCYLLQMLSQREMHILQWWEERSRKYLNAVESRKTAVKKLVEELTGTAKSDLPQNFDTRLHDAFAEISTVCELSTRGYSKFEALIPPKKTKAKTESAPDYRCFFTPHMETGGAASPKQACLEVKNLRAPIGIFDTFIELYAKLSASCPSLSRRSFVLTHYWDNTATPEHRQEIANFLNSLADCPTPYDATLLLKEDETEIKVEVKVEEGTGVCLQRIMGGNDRVGPFTKPEALMKKAREKIQYGLKQLKSCENVQCVLALNVQTFDSGLDSWVADQIQQVVSEESGDTIKFVLLHDYHLYSHF